MLVGRETKLYPVSYSHEFLCSLLEPSECTEALHDLCTIVIAVEVLPKADRKRVDQAFDRLQRRHDVLRSRFTREEGPLRVSISDHTLAKANWIEAGDIDDNALKLDILARTRERWDIYQGPMLRLDIFERPNLGDVMVFQICHAVVDGFGLATLMEDYIKLLAGVPLLTRPPKFEAFSKIVTKENATNLQQKKAYWENLIFPTIPVPNFGRKSKGLPLHGGIYDERSCGKVSRALDADVSARVAEYLKKNGLTYYGHLAAVTQATFRDYSGDDALYFTGLVGRHETQLQNFAGMHVNRLTGVCRPDFGSTIQDQGRAMTDQIRESITQVPFRMIDPDGEMTQRIRDEGGSKGQIRLTVVQSARRMQQVNTTMGTLGSRFAHGLKLREFPVIERPALLNDFSILASGGDDGQNLGFVYDELVFSNEEVNSFADQFVDHLTSVI